MSEEQQNITLVEIYRFLAQSMRYPEADWLDDTYWSVLTTLLTELEWHEELNELTTPRNNIADQLEDLQVEHTRLFINAVPHVLAPPYASVYAHVDGSLYGPIAEKTKKFYGEKGYSLSQNDIPDHIVYELEFLAILADQDPEACEEFLKILFLPWFPLFQERVLAAAKLPFYPVMVKLIDFFTRQESL
ncbi:MAG: molecular chaperone TorD family protein [Desulfobulbaceae bacterium]|uniref:Molecular chaperone TorD family protein n=1 Tax=Candidatus Desulfobia pelagia TaxID=2841692 RepID=A0A8J6NFN0_9BACT|nr:molecular chaperone TorD family protein [Candidatus Desulfobia pelagia]